MMVIQSHGDFVGKASENRLGVPNKGQAGPTNEWSPSPTSAKAPLDCNLPIKGGPGAALARRLGTPLVTRVARPPPCDGSSRDPAGGEAPVVTAPPARDGGKGGPHHGPQQKRRYAGRPPSLALRRRRRGAIVARTGAPPLEAPPSARGTRAHECAGSARPSSNATQPWRPGGEEHGAEHGAARGMEPAGQHTEADPEGGSEAGGNSGGGVGSGKTARTMRRASRLHPEGRPEEPLRGSPEGERACSDTPAWMKERSWPLQQRHCAGRVGSGRGCPRGMWAEPRARGARSRAGPRAATCDPEAGHISSPCPTTRPRWGDVTGASG